MIYIEETCFIISHRKLYLCSFFHENIFSYIIKNILLKCNILHYACIICNSTLWLLFILHFKRKQNNSNMEKKNLVIGCSKTLHFVCNIIIIYFLFFYFKPESIKGHFARFEKLFWVTWLSRLLVNLIGMR